MEVVLLFSSGGAGLQLRAPSFRVYIGPLSTVMGEAGIDPLDGGGVEILSLWEVGYHNLGVEKVSGGLFNHSSE